MWILGLESLYYTFVTYHVSRVPDCVLFRHNLPRPPQFQWRPYWIFPMLLVPSLITQSNPHKAYSIHIGTLEQLFPAQHAPFRTFTTHHLATTRTCTI